MKFTVSLLILNTLLAIFWTSNIVIFGGSFLSFFFLLLAVATAVLNVWTINKKRQNNKLSGGRYV